MKSLDVIKIKTENWEKEFDKFFNNIFKGYKIKRGTILGIDIFTLLDEELKGFISRVLAQEKQKWEGKIPPCFTSKEFEKELLKIINKKVAKIK